MHPRQRQCVEHREDLGFDLRRREAIAFGGNVGGAAAEQVRPIDPPAVGDRRNPTVPERRIAGEAMHHQHRCRRLPRPEVVVDGAVEGKPFS